MTIAKKISTKKLIKKNKDGLAITSFVLSLSGIFFCIIIILLPLGIISLILAIIFGIIALSKDNSKKWMSIIGISLSTISLIVILFIGLRFKDNIAQPIIETGKTMENIMKEDPEMEKLMNNTGFLIFLETKVDEKMKNKNEEFERKAENGNIETKDIINTVWGELPEIILQSKEEWKKTHPTK